jgi:hypothetical protein
MKTKICSLPDKDRSFKYVLLKIKESNSSSSGLPDGIFSYQISLFGYISERLVMKIVGIFNVHWVYLMSILYI